MSLIATELEGVLEQGESLSQFVESAVRTMVARRKNQAEFIRRGIVAIEATKRAGGGISAELVIARLETKLAWRWATAACLSLTAHLLGPRGCRVICDIQDGALRILVVQLGNHNK